MVGQPEAVHGEFPYQLFLAAGWLDCPGEQTFGPQTGARSPVGVFSHQGLERRKNKFPLAGGVRLSRLVPPAMVTGAPSGIQLAELRSPLVCTV